MLRVEICVMLASDAAAKIKGLGEVRRHASAIGPRADVATYLRIVASLVPKEVAIQPERLFEGMTLDELRETLAELRAINAAWEGAGDVEPTAIDGKARLLS